MAFDPSSLLGALVGAGAALGGIVLTQRADRKKTASDRIWVDRMAAYASAYEWSDVMRRELSRRRMLVETRALYPRPKPILNEDYVDLRVKMAMYSSRPVLDRYNDLIVTLTSDTFELPERLSDSTAEAIKKDIHEALMQCLTLQKAIRHETGDRAGV